MTSITKPQWPFYAAWIILTGLCLPVAFLLSIPIIKSITFFIGDHITVGGVRHITEDYLFAYILLSVAGLLVGLVQYALLRRYLLQIGWWILVTVLGWTVGYLLNDGLMQVVSRLWSMEVYFNGHWSEYVIFLLLGLSIGFWQWLVLRGRVPQAGWWIWANITGWALFALIYVNADRLGIELFVLESLPGKFLAVALWLLPGCTTAVTLAFFFNQNLEAELQPL
ncbi:MAG: hypothetical protein ACK2UP_00325 [Candidatus Promineifilaceae bacterium]